VSFAPDELTDLRRGLLAWYDEAARDLPWRTTGAPDPYRVWISEVMLQQTRVDTVIPYFERWTERFPSLQDLADADESEVLKAWEGLGYYRRARNLHAAVREVADRYGGEVPGDAEAFRELPGVGRYTAGAVLSIAFGEAEPVVDGNVRRVFARWLDDPAPAEGGLWELATSLVRADDGARPGDLNQAVMELGATVCTPRRPACDRCPVSDHCAARAAGTQEARPAPKRRAPLPERVIASAVIERDGEVLVGRRPDGGLLGGLWEFPGVQVAGDADPDALAASVGDALGIEVGEAATLGAVRHTFTHLRARYLAVRAGWTAGEPVGEWGELRWVRPAGLDALALPVAQRKIRRLAGV
jgi:A/G-specific adenine glycosylase